MRNREATLILGEGVAVIKRPGSSAPVVAGILGVDSDAAGKPLAVYLDRIVHYANEAGLGGWAVSGAVSTVLRACGGGGDGA